MIQARRSWLARISLSVGFVIGALPLAFGETTDPFRSALPSRDFSPPEGERPASGTVAEQSGAASYAIPIEVPAGRLGMQPSLALSYSSGGALRGDVAVGWSMGLPTIERDPDYPTEQRYRTSLGGGWQRLVGNDLDPGAAFPYRAEVDASFLRYEHDPSGTWTARSPDGHTYSFFTPSSERWYLRQERDPYGNTITYGYENVTVGRYGDVVPSSIEYTANASAGVSAHARVEYVYAPLELCGGAPVGATVDHRFGLWRMTGSRRLSEIRTLVRDVPGGPWRKARSYALDYDQDELACDASALRYLTGVRVSAFDAAGVETRAPAIQLGYGAKRRELGRSYTVWRSPQEVGTAKGATSGFLDVDGDGHLDAVEMIGAERCELHWRKGLADGQFESDPTTIELPSAPWFDGFAPDPARGERCTLAGQVVYRSDDWSVKHCAHRGVTVAYAYLDYDADGRLDLLTSVALGGDVDVGGDFSSADTTYFDIDRQNGLPACPQGMVNTGVVLDENHFEHNNCTCADGGAVYVESAGGCVDTCGGGTYDLVNNSCGGPAPGDTDPDFTGGAPQCAALSYDPEHVGASYVWRLQRNLVDVVGLETIEGTDTIPATPIFAPRPLPSQLAIEGLRVSPRPALPTLVDFNGDGYLDVISTAESADAAVPPLPGVGEYLYVWLGDGSESFPKGPVVWTFLKSLDPAAQGTSLMLADGVGIFDSTETVDLTDVDADGLPDLLFETHDGSLAVSYNLAGAFGGPAPYPMAGAFSAPVSLRFDSPVGETRTEATDARVSPTDLYLEGTRGSVRRFLDVDGDGASELVAQVIASDASIEGEAVARVANRLRSGATGLTLDHLGAEWEPVESLMKATIEPGTGRTVWQRTSDLLDLTGDGRPDAVTYDSHGTATIRTDTDAASLRLLTSIDNGRGGVTRFDYASTNAKGVVELRGRPAVTRVVVTGVTVSPGFDQPAMRTTYHYAEPILGKTAADDDQPHAPSFLGFGEVTVASSGSEGDTSRRVVSRYDYAPLGRDFGGRLRTRSTEYQRGSAYVPLSYDTYRYEWAPLLDGNIGASYLAESEARTCDPGDTLEDCAAQAEAVTTRETWEPWSPAFAPPSGPSLLVHRSTRVSVPDEVERYSRSTYELWWSDTEYRVQPTLAERGAVLVFDTVYGTMTLFAPASRTETSYDARGLPFEVRASQDASTVATTRSEFDDLGMVTHVIRPRQVAAGSTLGAWMVYDPLHLRVALALDELGRLVTHKFDTATGAPLERQGPAMRSTCAPSVSCSQYVFETERWTIDGFGRTTAHQSSFDPPAGSYGYVLRTDLRVDYDDQELPGRVVTSRLRDAATGAMIVDETTFDGAGRAIAALARRQTPGQRDAWTYYHYDQGGALARLETPDPQANDGSEVTTSYQRDGAGRVTAVLRPDGSSEQIAYRGLETEISELASEGVGARTTQRRSLFGDVVEIDEHDNPRPGEVATTSYLYDSLGRVHVLRDAEGETTSFGYDWMGHRTEIDRGDRHQRYEFDLDGNLFAATEPVPDSGDPADYRSTTSYDVVDRPTVHHPAPRELDADRRAELGIGDVTTTYEPSSDRPATMRLPFAKVSYAYDARGNLTREERTVQAPSMSQEVTQWVQREHDALGAPTLVTWDDGSQWRYQSDARGAVVQVDWRDPSSGLFTPLATYERGIVGQPRTREARGQRREWQYDVLGRVTYDRVWNPDTGSTYAEQNYQYDGFGNVATVSGVTNGMRQDVTFGYDASHRLVSASGADDYKVGLDYSATGNVLTADVQGAPSARNVDYAYSAEDPQAVEQLTDHATGDPVGTFGYDASGQMVRRDVSGDDATLAWDADGMLREVATDDGAVERYFFGPAAERMIAIDDASVRIWFHESETVLDRNGGQPQRYLHVAAGEPIARIEDSKRVELQYADTLQNLLLAVSLGGDVTASFVYGAFGEILGSTGEKDHHRQFNGKEHDAILGLHHYGYRSYDPLLLRWISADPVASLVPDGGSPQMANRYSFSGNNPVRYLDPDGRWPKLPPGPPPVPIRPGDIKTEGSIDAVDTANSAVGNDPAAVQQMVAWLQPADVATLKQPTLDGGGFMAGPDGTDAWTSDYSLVLFPMASAAVPRARSIALQDAGKDSAGTADSVAWRLGGNFKLSGKAGPVTMEGGGSADRTSTHGVTTGSEQGYTAVATEASTAKGYSVTGALALIKTYRLNGVAYAQFTASTIPGTFTFITSGRGPVKMPVSMPSLPVFFRSGAADPSASEPAIVGTLDFLMDGPD